MDNYEFHYFSKGDIYKKLLEKFPEERENIHESRGWVASTHLKVLGLGKVRLDMRGVPPRHTRIGKEKNVYRRRAASARQKKMWLHIELHNQRARSEFVATIY